MNMSKIDIDKFVASILGDTESDFFSLDSDDIRNALADQHLEYKDGQIKPVEKSQSEDERIRKALIEYFNEQCDMSDWNGIYGYQVVAWLERQVPIDKEKVLIGARKDIALSIINYLDNNTQGMCLSNMECEDIEDACINSKWTKLYNYMKKKLEKQGEKTSIVDFKAEDWYVSKVDGKIRNITHNPADNIKPKFKIGDWIIDSQGLTHQIKRVVENVTTHTFGYDIVGGGYFNDNTEGIRLWTIQDAKDGDVLARNNDILSICIFSHFDGIHNKYGSFLCYCGLEGEGLGQELSINGYHDDSEDYVPATKEQCDLLFQNMEGAGYEWDAEDKELKKIEQKIAWSEEDETYLKQALEEVEYALNDKNLIYTGNEDVLIWLKSIKDRIT